MAAILLTQNVLGPVCSLVAHLLARMDVETCDDFIRRFRDIKWFMVNVPM